MDGILFFGTLFFVVPSILIIVTLNIIQNIKKKKIKKLIDKLEYEKNVIDSTPIVPELAKIETFLKNEKLETLYNDWKEKLNDLKTKQIPKLTDMLLEAEYSLSQRDYKNANYKVVKIEMEIYYVKANSEFLLCEIKKVTDSEEKNRSIITNLKSKYRTLYEKFTSKSIDFGEIETSVSMQFESIGTHFEEFEKAMENNDYAEVTQIIKAIDDLLKHMELVIEEMPSIILMTSKVLPKKLEDINSEYKYLVRLGYQLDYLNVEYNVEEANKKIEDIITRSRVLNLEDSTFELKILNDYLDSLFSDFEKERRSRSTYEETNRFLEQRITKTNMLVNDIFLQLNELKRVYNLSEQDIGLLEEIKKQLSILNNDYKTLNIHTSNNAFAYSKLISEIENLSNRLNIIDAKLDESLQSIGNMKEDEARAREQLEEIKEIFKEAKKRINEYKFPTIPKLYYVELNEGASAIKEVISELDKKPITINILNTRVDTARDLVLKLHSHVKDIINQAKLAEMALVYANRYRSTYEEMDRNLTNSENFFYNGDYQKSLDLTVSYLNRLEPNILDKLMLLMRSE